MIHSRFRLLRELHSGVTNRRLFPRSFHARNFPIPLICTLFTHSLHAFHDPRPPGGRLKPHKPQRSNPICAKTPVAQKIPMKNNNSQTPVRILSGTSLDTFGHNRTHCFFHPRLSPSIRGSKLRTPSLFVHFVSLCSKNRMYQRQSRFKNSDMFRTH
jgi:hypothetical protein